MSIVSKDTKMEHTRRTDEKSRSCLHMAISSPLWPLLKRLDALVAAEHLKVNARFYSYTLALKHINMKPFEVPFLKF